MTKLKPRTTTVTLFQGDDFDRERELRGVVEAAVMADSNTRRMNDPDTVSVAADAYDAFVKDATTRGETIPLAMLPRGVWREMVAKHPPRDDSEGDERWGFNYLTLADDLVPASVAAGQEIEPSYFESVEVLHFDSLGDRDEFLDALCDADFTKVYNEALNLNQAAGPNPKVRLSSLLAQTSDEISPPPIRLG